jgi:CarD family transcriptional regulator
VFERGFPYKGGAAMFSCSEKVVYPGHGVAKVNRIIEKKIAGNKASFFELKFLSKDMTILVPVNNAISVGIRRLSSKERIDTICKMISEPMSMLPQQDVVVTNWNKRNKEYQGKLRTGDLQEICKIYKDLHYMSIQKDLSFGEKTLLQQTESLLSEEIAIVKNISEDDATEHLRFLISSVCSFKKEVMDNI